MCFSIQHGQFGVACDFAAGDFGSDDRLILRGRSAVTRRATAPTKLNAKDLSEVECKVERKEEAAGTTRQRYRACVRRSSEN
jgi:hypothetical protein